MTTAAASSRVAPDAPPVDIDRKLRGAFRRGRTFVHMRAACRLITWVAALVLAALLIDWLLLLPPAGRIALLGISGVLLLGVIWRHWLRHLRRFDPVRVALQVERAYPQLSSVLVSYVQFAEQVDDPQSTASPALLRAVRRQAAEQSAALDFERIVDFTRLQKRLSIAMLAMLLLLGAIVAWTPYFQVFAARMTDPFSMRSYPTRTKIDPADITGDVTVKQGESVAIAARAAGMVPQTGAILVRTDGGDWQRVNVERGDGDRFAHRFDAVHQSFDYRLDIGDYRSATYRVTVVPPPRIVSVSVDQQYPAYTNRGRETTDSLNMQVPQGTTLAWRIEFDRPLKSARMLEVGRRPVLDAATVAPAEPEPDELTDVTLSADGRLLTAEAVAERSFDYRLAFTDAEHGYAYDPQVRYSVHVTPDAAPEAELLRPREIQQIGTKNKKIDLTYRLSDDYGLKSAAVVYAVNDNEEQRRPLDVFDNERIAEGRFTWNIARTIPDLSEGDVITWAVEVTDNRAGEPNTARSVTRTLTIVSIAAYQQMIFERISELGEELETVHEMEREGSKAVEQLKEQAE